MKVTGLILAFTINTAQHICCRACGRKRKLFAALHCFFLGWWGIKSFLTNLLVLPYNLLGAAFIFVPREPSAALVQTVKERLADQHAPELCGSWHGSGDQH